MYKVEKPIEKLSQGSNYKIANYDQEMKSIWLEFGHEPDIKITDSWNWATRQVEARR